MGFTGIRQERASVSSPNRPEPAPALAVGVFCFGSYLDSVRKVVETPVANLMKNRIGPEVARLVWPLRRKSITTAGTVNQLLNRANDARAANEPPLGAFAFCRFLVMHAALLFGLVVRGTA